jgi:hypothetical protein
MGWRRNDGQGRRQKTREVKRTVLIGPDAFGMAAAAEYLGEHRPGRYELWLIDPDEDG